MQSNVYFLAKFRFDTAENEPAKNLQKFCKICKILQNFAKFANHSFARCEHAPFRLPPHTHWRKGDAKEKPPVKRGLRTRSKDPAPSAAQRAATAPAGTAPAGGRDLS